MAEPTTPRNFSMMGIEMNVKLTKEETANSASAIEQVVSKGSGSPEHILYDADKMIYVIEGKFYIRNGEYKIEGEPGTLVFIPRGAVHNFKNIGETPGKILVTLTPGGHERFLYDLSLEAAMGKPSREIMNEVGRRHRVEMV